jgi:hypothetical protein
MPVLNPCVDRTNRYTVYTMVAECLNPIANRIAGYLIEIGLPVRARAVPNRIFVPDSHVANGVLIVDEARLTYPGDLLQEVGHLAVTPAARRNSVDGDTGHGLSRARRPAVRALAPAAFLNSQGLKPNPLSDPTARLKSCPDTHA